MPEDLTAGLHNPVDVQGREDLMKALDNFVQLHPHLVGYEPTESHPTPVFENRPDATFALLVAAFLLHGRAQVEWARFPDMRSALNCALDGLSDYAEDDTLHV